MIESVLFALLLLMCDEDPLPYEPNPKAEVAVKKLVLKLTHRLWNHRISALLCRAQQQGKITSRQLHDLTAMFDPTQKHQVY